MDISERLKSIRVAKNMSVYKLSQLSGVSETQIRDLERGDRNPSIDTLCRLVEPMGVPVSELFTESNNMTVLSDEEKALLDCYRMLSKDKAESLLIFLKTLV